VVYVGPYGYPYYNQWFQYGPWGPFPPMGYGYPLRDELTSSLRLDVTPRQAAVFVDGYAAGKVDDFDGIFQRLRLRPGQHEIVLYLEAYRTVRQHLYLGPGSDQKVRYTMEPLGAGEIAEPPPPPAEPPQGAEDEPPVPMRPFDQGPRPAPQGPSRESSSRFGMLAIRVQPGDAEILVDGERWSAPSGQDRIVIQLSEGRHHVEIRKDGFAQYLEDVLIRRDATLALNVSLLRGDGNGR
jgi:hypothetical protein